MKSKDIRRRLKKYRTRVRLKNVSILTDYLISKFNDPGHKFTPREQAMYFSSLFKINGFNKTMNAAEIGVFLGQNLYSMAQGIPHCFFYGVDPYKVFRYGRVKRSFQPKWHQEHWDKAYKDTVDKFSIVPNVKLIRKKSENAVWEVPDNLLYVYIDGSHDYYDVIDDITLWEEKCACGAIISGHDYNGVKYQKVTKAVNHYAKIHNRKIRNPAYGIWWWYKE
jgi:hypothetical protein